MLYWMSHWMSLSNTNRLYTVTKKLNDESDSLDKYMIAIKLNGTVKSEQAISNAVTKFASNNASAASFNLFLREWNERDFVEWNLYHCRHLHRNVRHFFRGQNTSPERFGIIIQWNAKCQQCVGLTKLIFARKFIDKYLSQISWLNHRITFPCRVFHFIWPPRRIFKLIREAHKQQQQQSIDLLNSFDWNLHKTWLHHKNNSQ